MADELEKGDIIAYNLNKNYPGSAGGEITEARVREIIAEELKGMQKWLTAGEGLGWEDETSNILKVIGKINALDGAVTLNPDDFVNESNTIKIKK